MSCRMRYLVYQLKSLQRGFHNFGMRILCKKLPVGILVFFSGLTLHLEAVIPEKVIICTICRDVSPLLPELISDLESIGSLFQDYRIVAYENNSEDDTPSQLFRAKRNNPKISVKVEFLSDAELAKSIVNQKEGQYSMSEQRAVARNKALTMALTSFEPEFSYIICMDPNVKLTHPEELEAVFQQAANWDSIFAYKTDRNGKFNDWEAFRDKNFPFGPELMGNDWYEEKEHFSFQNDGSWYPVYSAFGGLAIYKRKAVENCRYSALVTRDLESVARKSLYEGLSERVPSVTRYFQSLEHITNLIYIDSPIPSLPKLSDVNCGVYITNMKVPIVWKMHGSSDRFPAVCEHVTLHASMYSQGYQRLFINSRLVCVERDSHYESHPSSGEL